jgi:hypothetical protein
MIELYFYFYFSLSICTGRDQAAPREQGMINAIERRCRGRPERTQGHSQSFCSPRIDKLQKG